jgi:hypothetical protein
MKIKLHGKYSDKECLIDDKDYPKIKDKRWYGREVRNDRVYYATTSRSESMHKIILGTKKGFVIDHINGNGLDNRRENLRFCSQKQNSRNNRRRKDKKYTSKYKGVWKYNYDSGRIGWVAQITVNDKAIHLGIFRDEEEAGYAYNQAAKKYFGDFACLNKLPKKHYNLPSKEKRKKRSLKNLEKRNQNLITYKNETHNIAEWAKIKGIKRQTLGKRLRSGWDVEEALNTPVKKFITYWGEKKTLYEWAEIKNIKYGTLKCRLHRGWDVERALNTN